MLEAALHSLLRVRSSEEMGLAVVDAARRLASARAAALYEQRDGSWELRASCGPGATGWQGVAEEISGRAPGLVGILGLAERSGPSRGPGMAAALPVGEERRFLLLLGPRLGGEPYGRDEEALLERFLDPCSIALHNAERFDQLSSLVLVDPLTGCYNRRGFDEHLKVEMVRARRYRRALSILVLDVDHFKEVNDGFGHPVGDVVLQRIGEVLRSEFRTTDVVSRLGGDEFAVIFPETPRDEVLRLAERLRARIETLYPAEPLPRLLTASVGIAAYPGHANEIDALLRAADRALYRAKAGGRNRVASA